MPYNVTGAFLGTVTALFVVKCLLTQDARLFEIVGVSMSFQLGLFVAWLVGVSPPFPFRLAGVAILLSYFAIMMATLLTGAKLLAPSQAFLVTWSTALGLFIVEAMQELPQLKPPIPSGNNVEWSVRLQTHPLLGKHYVPYSEIKTYYPNNPRGYFKTEDPRRSKWQFYVHDDNFAELLFPGGNEETLRIDIKDVKSKVPWHVQLSQNHLSLKKNRSYSLAFKSRAQSPRRIAVAVSKNHEPWDSLGLYKELELTSEWRSFHLEFMASATDNNARIHFDVGGDTSAVELSDVMLLGLPNGEPVITPLKTKYFVSYKINGLGCRARDYVIPRAKNTTRILLLGDSYTMGVGVHEEDTFAYQLERLLNAEGNSSFPETKYEVINCGESGFSTRDERLYYEIFGARYHPDLVLLVMVWNDDISWTEEQRMPHINRRAEKLEYLFFTMSWIQRYRYKRPFPDYSGSLKEILQLRSQLKKQGKRLAVVFFRDLPESDDSTWSRYWNQLAATVRNGLQGTDVPILDLRDALFATHSLEELQVDAVDAHPNEIAHEIAANEIMKFLHRENLLWPVTSR